ncbi:pseudaminic acid biosynthesis-associated methylase [Motilibacter aurantiacus]|uniref:pseudaminic acid biosynthesis-associated methylase n=1 Tax=Motilibacter aurantiacus TaxID=2714955 RepID=UPI002F2B9094
MPGDSTYATAQEEFWSGEFGDRYSERNVGARWVSANTALFSKVLSGLSPVSSVLEIGANIGLNVRALQTLLPEAEIAGLEINAGAADELEKTGCTVFRGSALDFTPPRAYDFTFTKGVLIHIAPEALNTVYDLLYNASNRYVFVAEYYNPRPETIVYHGEQDRLFKRDWAGDLLDRFPDLRLVDTGFAYHRGPFPQDDLTWFTLEKTS